MFYKRNGSDSVAFEMNSIFFLKKEKKRNLQQNVNSQVKSHREIAGPDVLLQFWCSFLLLLFSLSLAPFFFTARWLSLRFLRWFSPEPVSYEVPKRAEMESSSFLSPPKKHIESTTFRWNVLEIKRPTWDVKFQNKIPFSATYANRSSKRIEVDSIWTIHRPPCRRFFKFF